jgi:ATP-dependent Clp protease ATP-binding subunit ClpA
MALQLSPEASEAIDLAKRTVDKGGEITVELLMAAAYERGDMDDELPGLAQFLPPVKPRRKTVPKEVSVHEGLQPVFVALKDDDFITIDELMAALLTSARGRAYLAEQGAPGDLVKQAIELAGGEVLLDTKRGDTKWKESEERKKAIEALNAYGRMLTDIDLPAASMVEVEVPIRRLQKSLVKMKRRNVIVVGHPGTGKTALVYEFARRIQQGHSSITPLLRDSDVFELSSSFLKAGAGRVGEYESRLSALLKVLKGCPQIIVFVDEVHSLLQSGMHERTPWSEANEAFKQALGHGEITVIGATTTAEYRHYIAPDGALSRRFGMLKIEPPSRDGTITILNARLERLRNHYKPLVIPEAMVERTVDLAEEFLPSRFQPDKSIQLIDEACALASITEPPQEELNEEALIEALEDTIGHGVVRPETLTVESVLGQLSAKIVGQEAALEQITRTFVAGLDGDWKAGDGPRGIFLFCGPTGVGKTETALQLAKIIGGGSEALLRVDCNTLSSGGLDPKGPVANRLLGPPPGYVGYVRGQGGELSKIRDLPQAVVLFDEIEKAHPVVAEILLQIIDEGRVQDADSNLLDFRRSFIVFTTNAGTTYESAGGPIGFGLRGGQEEDKAGSGSPHVTVEDVKEDLRRRGHREEFLGRNIDFVVFHALDRSSIRKILERQIEKIDAEAELQGYDIEAPAEVLDHLADQWQPRFGVRHLTTILRHRILEQLSIAQVQGELEDVSIIRLAIMEDADVGSLGGRRVEDGTLTILLS